MPRKSRFFIPNVPNHVVQRGKNRDPVFFEDSDYQFYLSTLFEALTKYEGQLHAYVLMTNHVHLLITGKEESSVSRIMQYIGRRYVPYINHKYGYSGSIWEGRFKSNLIDTSEYLFVCMKYIELNPVRANMVERPEAFRYSSFHGNALNRADILLTEHEEYLKFSDNKDIRCSMYRSLFDADLDKDDLQSIREGYKSGTPIGSERFIQKIEQALDRKVGKTKPGRPKVGG